MRPIVSLVDQEPEPRRLERPLAHRASLAAPKALVGTRGAGHVPARTEAAQVRGQLLANRARPPCLLFARPLVLALPGTNVDDGLHDALVRAWCSLPAQPKHGAHHEILVKAAGLLHRVDYLQVDSRVPALVPLNQLQASGQPSPAGQGAQHRRKRNRPATKIERRQERKGGGGSGGAGGTLGREGEPSQEASSWPDPTAEGGAKVASARERRTKDTHVRTARADARETADPLRVTHVYTPRRAFVAKYLAALPKEVDRQGDGGENIFKNEKGTSDDENKQ